MSSLAATGKSDAALLVAPAGLEPEAAKPLKDET
jgi:hypothetical protein